MATLNIRRDVDDVFYRYKMHPIQSKIEGKGNGIKTVVPNMAEVAHDLSRPEIYITKFFGFELGAQAKVVGQGQIERHIVNGAHEKEKLQDLLDVFINKFVLCGDCKNPETVFAIKGQRVFKECKACGKSTEVDKGHKLTSFIVKNPPKGTVSSGETNGKKGGKKSRKGKHNKDNGEEEGANGADPGSPAGSEEGDDEESIARITSEVAELVEPETKLGEDEWGVDTSTAAVLARQKALEETMAKVAIAAGDDDDDDEEGFANGENPYDQLGIWIQDEHNENGQVPDDVEIYKKAKELGIEARSKTLTVLVQCVFTKNICKEISARAALFHKVIHNSLSQNNTDVGQLIDENPKAEKNLLGGLERFVGLTHPDLIPQIPKILLAFYNGAVLSEDALLKWGTKKASGRFVDKDISRKVRKAATPFLKWLEEAEEE
jgi:translation initiation factor 5